MSESSRQALLFIGLMMLEVSTARSLRRPPAGTCEDMHTGGRNNGAVHAHREPLVANVKRFFSSNVSLEGTAEHLSFRNSQSFDLDQACLDMFDEMQLLSEAVTLILMVIVRLVS